MHDLELRESLAEVLEGGSGGSLEKMVEIVYQAQAKFRVSPSLTVPAAYQVGTTLEADC